LVVLAIDPSLGEVNLVSHLITDLLTGRCLKAKELVKEVLIKTTVSPTTVPLHKWELSDCH